MKVKLKGGINVYRNGKLIASTHNNITSSFISSLVKSLIGSSPSFSGYFGMPKTAVVKFFNTDAPVTSAVLSNVSFIEEVIGGYEHTRIIYSFSDSSRTKYSFNKLQLWTALTNSLLLNVSEAQLDSPLTKNPQDVVQIDWWVEMVTAQPFNFILQYLQQQQSVNCSAGCNIPSFGYNMQNNFGAFNMMFAMLALPNILDVSRNIKSPLTDSLSKVLPLASQISPLGITKVACVDICSCNTNNNTVNNTVNNISGYLTETIDNNYVTVAYNFNNPCQAGQYVIPISTIQLSQSYSIDLAILAVPSKGTGTSTLLIKIPYGSATLNKLSTHQGE